MSNEQFYLDRAAEALREVEVATLDNVRDRAQRSCDAWTQMARRAGQTEALRARRNAEQAATAAASAPVAEV